MPQVAQSFDRMGVFAPMDRGPVPCGGGAARLGRDQLTAVYRDALAAVAMDFRFEFDEIVIRGDTAVARTRTSGANTVRATGEVVPAHYRELFVLQRLEGDWKITQYMFQPMP